MIHGMTNIDVIIAPAIEAVEYEWVQWPNRFTEESKFRGKPTSITEEAWYNITYGR